MHKYLCWIPDYGQERKDGRKVYAIDAESAAEFFIETYESLQAEYPVGSGGNVEIAVAEDGLEPNIYLVTGNPRPDYRAERITGREE